MSGDHQSVAWLKRLSEWLDWVVAWAEGGIALILALVIAGSIVSLAYTVTIVGFEAFPFNSDMFTKVVKAVLDIFILIELFRITIAYVQHGDVIPTVLETALVVAAREVVVVEAGKDNPIGGGIVALTLVAIGLAWWLLRKAQAVSRHDRINLRYIPDPAKTDEPIHPAEESE